MDVKSIEKEDPVNFFVHSTFLKWAKYLFFYILSSFGKDHMFQIFSC